MMPNISTSNKKMKTIPQLILATSVDLIPNQNLQKYISFGMFFSQFPVEAKCLFQYMAKVINYDGGVTELCRLCNNPHTYTEKKTGKIRYDLTQFKKLGIERLEENGVISVIKKGHGKYNIKLNPLFFGE